MLRGTRALGNTCALLAAIVTLLFATPSLSQQLRGPELVRFMFNELPRADRYTIQHVLTDYGASGEPFYTGQIDGRFGARTLSALNDLNALWAHERYGSDIVLGSTDALYHPQQVSPFFQEILSGEIYRLVEPSLCVLGCGQLEPLSIAEAVERAVVILMGDPYGRTPDETRSFIQNIQPGGSTDAPCDREGVWLVEVRVPPSAATNGQEISGSLTIDAVTGELGCAGLPFLN